MKKNNILYSIVIPVYNSSLFIENTLKEVTKAMDDTKLFYEIVLVNDGSNDDSWKIINNFAKKNKFVTAINLLKNYGQHIAVFCGLKNARGDYVITIDDDLQNPPQEIIKLINKAKFGYDLVIGSFDQKKHSLFRRLGSFVINSINRRIFDISDDLKLTNFRLIRKDVVSRMINYNTSYPYITGLSLLMSGYRCNVSVKHDVRKFGKSNYNLKKLLKLVFEILFNYSSVPMKFVSTIGITVSGFSFITGCYFFISALINDNYPPGWASLFVFLTFINGLVILLLGMIGEYLIRISNQINNSDKYFISDIQK